jgi:AI-2 transport protein TqsA
MHVEIRRIGEYIIVLASAVVLFGGMRLATPVLGPLLLMVFFSILCRPIYEWLLRKGLRTSLAISLVGGMLIGVASLLVWIILGSLYGLAGQLDEYSEELTQQIDNMSGFIALLGVGNVRSPAALGGSILIGGSLTIISTLAGFAMSFFYVVIGALFLILDGPRMWNSLQRTIGTDNILVIRLGALPPDLVTYFGLRTYLNAATGLTVGLALFLLGIDYAALWAVLIFLMSYVPYVGLFIAGAPPVVLALAQYGVPRALLVIAIIVVVNMIVENIAMPRMAGDKFSLSAFVSYISFFFWTWLIGPAGAMMSSFLTLLLIRVLDSFEGSQWVAAMLMPYAHADEPEPDRSLAST